MRFGDYIRNLRQERRWTQPEAAKQIGIEQSYLSKLESGKSYPSEDVFASLMTAYALDLDGLGAALFPAELDRLREISQVRAAILSTERDAQKHVQRWLSAGIALLMLGGAGLGAALLGKDQVVDTFQYKSEGVVLEGEDVNAFEVIGDRPSGERDGQPAASERQQEMIDRIDEQYQALETYRGVVFFETVPKGQRAWRFYGSSNEVRASWLRWFLIPAIMMMMGAVGCFFASYRSR